MLTAQNLRQKYLEFFKEKGHAIIPSDPLVPENDPAKHLQKELLILLSGILTEISLF